MWPLEKGPEELSRATHRKRVSCWIPKQLLAQLQLIPTIT